MAAQPSSPRTRLSAPNRELAARGVPNLVQSPRKAVRWVREGQVLTSPRGVVSPTGTARS